MVRQYPYELWVSVQPESAQDSSGNFIQPDIAWTKFSDCRDEAMRGSIPTLDDSTPIDATALVQLPKACPNIPEGTPIEIRDGVTVRLATTAKRFSREQMHCRLWV